MDRDSTELAWPARLSGLLEAAWSKGLANRPSLDPADLIDTAMKREGAPPATGAWRARLDCLCAALAQEAAVSPLGRTIAHGQLVRILASRIRAERLLAKDCAIRDRPMPAPVVIVGQMRSGTTRVHRLLACDPRFAHTRLFETLDPVPSRRWLDRRIVSAVASVAFLRLCNPALAAIHPTSAFACEEEFGLHAYSLWGAQFEAQWWVPGFVARCEAAPAEEAADVYREFKMLLQLAARWRRLGADQPWLLKAPQFCQDLNALIEVFPDARIIRLQREPERVVGSGASLVWHQMRIQSDAVSRSAIGSEWLRKTALREQRLSAALGSGVPHLTIDYDEVSSDWRGAMRKIYDFVGTPLTADVERRMTRFVARSTAHRGHHYALEQFGLDQPTVRAAFA